MLSKRVLIIEDEAGIAEAMCEYLEAAVPPPHFQVRLAITGTAGLAACLRWKPDVVVMDLGLPGLSGEELLKTFTVHCPRTKVCVVSGKFELDERLEVFALGADDYLVKPFSGRELVARVSALCRRDKLTAAYPLTIGGLTLEWDGKVRLESGVSTRLSRTERRLLGYLMERSGQAISRDELLETVWSGKDRYPNIVDATVESLRRKLRELDGRRYVHTAYRSGYYFEATANDEIFSGRS